MKVATAQELSASSGDTGVDKHIDDDNTLDHISLDTKMTADKNDGLKKICENNDNNDELTRINKQLNNDNESLPFVIENKEGVGNFVVASRDIKPNEVNNINFKLHKKILIICFR